ncbi:hypothetical protein [Burkholderia sp. AW49-1]
MLVDTHGVSHGRAIRPALVGYSVDCIVLNVLLLLAKDVDASATDDAITAD